MDKAALRKEFLMRRGTLSPEKRRIADGAIRASLGTLPECVDATLIGAFITDGTEPDLKPLLAAWILQGKRIFLPRYDVEASASYRMVEIIDLEQQLVVGKYALPEPIAALPPAAPEQQRQLTWLVPGVAYDATGGRLGRGRGVYDRLLESSTGTTIGVFYSCQKTTAVPRSRHDRKLDMVVTETEIIRATCKSSRGSREVLQLAH